MYADLDFFLALLKKEDWLKEKAEEIYRKHHREIWTSTITLQEIMLYASRERLNLSEFIERMLSLTEIREINITVEMCLAVTDLISRFNMTPFDAFHAMICEGDEIISSDNSYDRIGLRRVRLEGDH